MAGLNDILTSAQNIVTAINAAALTYLAVNGTTNSAGLTTTTVVSTKPGRVVNVVVVATGGAAGTVYDAAATGTTTRPLYTIPATVGVYPINMPAQYGIVVAPGAGQTITVSFS